MPKGYWIAHVSVTDPSGYPKYIAANAAAFKKYGARFLVRAGRFKNLESMKGERHVVIEFPSYETAIECYESSEYQEALKLRLAYAKGELVIVEGVA